MLGFRETAKLRSYHFYVGVSNILTEQVKGQSTIPCVEMEMVECCINVESKENGDFTNGASDTMANLKGFFFFFI